MKLLGLRLLPDSDRPVKGFAVTLTIGIAVSMFTAIFVSRTVFETVFRLRRVTALSI